MDQIKERTRRGKKTIWSMDRKEMRKERNKDMKEGEGKLEFTGKLAEAGRKEIKKIKDKYKRSMGRKKGFWFLIKKRYNNNNKSFKE